jgi:hypothetical protein
MHVGCDIVADHNANVVYRNANVVYRQKASSPMDFVNADQYTLCLELDSLWIDLRNRDWAVFSPA